MELSEKNFKLIKYGMISIAVIVVLSAAITVYDRIFSQDKIIKQLEESNLKINSVIETNRKIEKQLQNAKQEINLVHKSLLESQVKLTELIKDTRGNTTVLKEKTKDVQNDLNKAIDDINKVLNNSEAQDNAANQ